MAPVHHHCHGTTAAIVHAVASAASQASSAASVVDVATESPLWFRFAVLAIWATILSLLGHVCLAICLSIVDSAVDRINRFRHRSIVLDEYTSLPQDDKEDEQAEAAVFVIVSGAEKVGETYDSHYEALSSA